MKFEKKFERLQAQAETFADKGVGEFTSEQAKFLKYSAELARITNLRSLPEDLPEELVDLIHKHTDVYVQFLRKEKNLELSFQEENIRLYTSTFKPVIADLKKKILTSDMKTMPEYLGSGSNGAAFRIVVDGKAYAAKFSRNVVQANFELKPLIRAKGIPHTSQLVSYSFEDTVVIMELLPGTTVTNFTPDNAPVYSEEHIVQLIETVRELHERGLVIDPKPSNFLYDEREGFFVLDYHVAGSQTGYSLPQIIMDLRFALTARRYPVLDYKAPDYEEKYKQQSLERYRISLPLLVQFLTILSEKFPKILSAWRKQHEIDKKNPSMSVGDIVDREYIPADPSLEPYLSRLAELGF